ncbi:uncharacterized protein LOC111106032 [Crassostrea virginica]|uniref:Uncharacterized protein LOC111106032 n=1 Tax=Crassostrea virginica TaxID=6565 RepID=A0A8B8AYL6_CRAVI|nr:uncharacterized protein LOC111106032 [Crassostrea virginica]
MKNLEISFALFFVIFTTKSAALVEWPFGTYTLVKPNAGCPSGWLEGWRYQDNEDHNNKNKMSYGHHFYGSFGRNLKFYYCTRNPNEFSGRRYWPSGNYCILKQGISCPTGFQTGSVYWDDEDRNNKNSYGGVLPSGEFGRNTRINYCCREDGPYNNTIQLPTTQPFYLLRFTSPCQMVQGMNFENESVEFDDEDNNNKNSVSGKYPLGASNGRNQRLRYCYYSPLGSK